MKDKKSIIIVIIVILILGVIGYIYYDEFINNKSANNGGSVEPINEEDTNTFIYSNNGSYGIALVKGYAEVKKASYCGDGIICTPESTISVNVEVNFYVISSNNQDLQKEIDSWYGEGYTGDKVIRLGCLKEKEIIYYNAADTFYDPYNTGIDNRENYDNYFKQFALDISSTEKILSSTKSKPITLKIEKLKLTTFGEAPACYSHMTYVSVIGE